MLRTQINLVLDVIQAETNGALRLTAIEIINEQDLYLLGHRRSISLAEWLFSANPTLASTIVARTTNAPSGPTAWPHTPAGTSFATRPLQQADGLIRRTKTGASARPARASRPGQVRDTTDPDPPPGGLRPRSFPRQAQSTVTARHPAAVGAASPARLPHIISDSALLLGSAPSLFRYDQLHRFMMMGYTCPYGFAATVTGRCGSGTAPPGGARRPGPALVALPRPAPATAVLATVPRNPGTGGVHRIVRR